MKKYFIQPASFLHSSSTYIHKTVESYKFFPNLASYNKALNKRQKRYYRIYSIYMRDTTP